MTDGEYTAPGPPAGLRSGGIRLWRATCAELELDSGDGLEMLRLACVALDEADAAAALVAKQGLTVTDRYGGVHEHPAAKTGRQARAQVTSIVAKLNAMADAADRLELAELRERRVRDAARAKAEARGRSGGRAVRR